MRKLFGRGIDKVLNIVSHRPLLLGCAHPNNFKYSFLDSELGIFIHYFSVFINFTQGCSPTLSQEARQLRGGASV